MAQSRPDREEREFLARYRPGDYPRPAVTVDIVVLTILDAELRVLLIQRKEHPFKGQWALPGGFVRVGDSQKDQGEDVDPTAAARMSAWSNASGGRSLRGHHWALVASEPASTIVPGMTVRW